MFDKGVFSVMSLVIYILTGLPIVHGLPQLPAAVRCLVSLPLLREFTHRWTTVAGKSPNSPPRHNHSLLYKGEEQRENVLFTGCDSSDGQSISDERS